MASDGYRLHYLTVPLSELEIWVALQHLMAEELLDDVDKAILFLNIPNIDDPSIISSPITVAATRTRTRLLIMVFCSIFDSVASSGSSGWDPVQKLLTHAYVQATTVSQQRNKILMNIDVILRGVESPASEEDIIDDWHMIFYSGNFSSYGLGKKGFLIESRKYGGISPPPIMGLSADGASHRSSRTYRPFILIYPRFNEYFCRLSCGCPWRHI